jgi:mannose-6-phosphate isomerase-like protein (cupin superfamily)
MTIPTRIALADMATAPLTPGRLSKLAFDTGEIELRFYAPQQVDNQVPHARDELYFVVHGSGTYEREAERIPFAPGDVLFAAAGERHRFVDFTNDFAVWVVFYGPIRRGAAAG